MNASTPTYDLIEVARFVTFWMTVTGVGHITLVSIQPDAGTDTRTFQRGDNHEMAAWIANAQRGGQNVYFQPNETFPNCASKPSKSAMMAGLSRFADIDPADGFPLAEERDRLGRLADHLNADTTFQPTVIIDSGNGIQVIWATVREVLAPKIIARIESETADIETSLGAGGTHNIDRLLRLPGTINFPNAAKQAKGRGIGRARMLYCADVLYSAAQIGTLAAVHLIATLPADLVRLKTKPAGPTSPDKNADIAALVTELETANADRISLPEHLSNDLRQRLDAAIKARPRLADRWAGMVDDLTEAGRDSSRSSADFSLAAMLKAARFSHVETAAILCAFAHGKANGDTWTGNRRLRYVARCALRSHEPKPRQADEIEWGVPVDFIADQDATPPELRPEHIPDALWPFVVDTAERMGVDKTSGALGGLTSLASVISDDWFIQPKMLDSTWLINARLWGLIIGDPSILKSPVIALVTRPIEWLDRQAREMHQVAMQTYRTDMAAWKKADDQSVPPPTYPRLARYLVEGATMEALSEVLRDDPDGKQYAPAKKVLCRQDEMSELFANMDRYKAGGKGDGDRGAYLRLFNGGPFNVDRIGRGFFRIPNWSAGIFGGCRRTDPAHRQRRRRRRNAATVLL